MDIQKNIPLASYTTVKIGGPADFFIHVQNSKELLEAIKYGQDNKLPITILGNGSNVLISDSGIRGIVIKNDSNEIEVLPNNKVKISSGTQISLAINFLAQNNLSGLEEFSYIPSSIGGAIYGNIHGFDKTNFSQLIESIEVFNLKTNQIETIVPNLSEWIYDFSPLQNQSHLIIISAILKLKSGLSNEIIEKSQTIYQQKSTKQLINSIGCVFKNISNETALKLNIPVSTGQIIDQKLNLKGYSIGDAQVSPLHANFIINNGHATASDYLKLIKYIQSLALEKLNLVLEPEIKFLGEF